MRGAPAPSSTARQAESPSQITAAIASVGAAAGVSQSVREADEADEAGDVEGLAAGERAGGIAVAGAFADAVRFADELVAAGVGAVIQQEK